jgi:hypothetical protein
MIAECGSSDSSTDASGVVSLPAKSSGHGSCEEFNKRFKDVESPNGHGAPITIHCSEDTPPLPAHSAPSEQAKRQCREAVQGTERRGEGVKPPPNAARVFSLCGTD